MSRQVLFERESTERRVVRDEVQSGENRTNKTVFGLDEERKEPLYINPFYNETGVCFVSFISGVYKFKIR